MALGKEDDNQEADKNTGSADDEKNSSNAQADDNSIPAGKLEIGGNVRGTVIHGNNNYALHIDNRDGSVVNVSPPSDQPSYSVRSSPLKTLPSDPSLFLDRTEALDSIETVVGTSTTVFIFGEKGIGKTSFVAYLIHHAEFSTSSELILYVDASGRGLGDLLQHLFDRFYKSTPVFIPREADLLEALQQPQGLIFIDHLELGPKETTALRNAMPGCRFILASLEPGSSGQKVGLKGLPEQDAIILFEQELASFVNVNHPLNKKELGALKKLCAIYQGNPSRIVEAAGQVAQGKSIFQLLEESKQGDPDTVLLQAVWSFLAENQKRILLILAAAGGPKLPLEHLVALAHDPDFLQTLPSLITLRLIQDHGGKYSLTGNLVSSLVALEDVSIWEDRLLNHFTHWLEGKPEQADIEESMEVLLYLQRKASEKQNWSTLIRFGIALEPGLILSKRWQAWSDLLNQIMEAAKALGDRKAEAWVLHQLGSRAMFLGQDEQARDHLNQALKLRKAIHDQAGLQVTQHNLNILLGIPVPPDVPRKLRLPKIRPSGGWITVGLGVAAASLLALIFFLARESASAPATTDTPTVTNTFTPTPSYTPTRTPTSTARPSQTPSNTPSATSTRSPTAVAFSIGKPQLSTMQLFFQGEGCGPNNVTIRVSAQAPSAIKLLVFFHRLHEVDTGEDSGWSSGLAMYSERGGIYSLTVTGDELIGTSGITGQASMSYQFTIQLTNGKQFNSEVYTDLSLLPCGPTPLEIIHVPIDGSPTQSATTLKMGITYRIEASGTFSVGSILSDAEYTDFNNASLSPQDICWADLGSAAPFPFDLGIGIDDTVMDHDKFPKWGAPNPNHVYAIDFLGRGATITVNYHDCLQHSSGDLVIKIYGP